MNVLELSAISKQYGALRPLRVEQLSLAAGAQVVIVGFDQPAAEVFISLVTGAGLPESGTVRAFGRTTAEITDSKDWLATLDGFGIVSDRAALIGPLTLIQNLSVPFTLDIEPPPPDVRVRAEALAREVGLDSPFWERRAADLDADARMRAHLARALAHDPALVLLEHPSAALERPQVAPFARDVRRVVSTRRIAAVTLTMDRDYATASGARVLTLDPANGRLSEARSGFRFWR